MLFNEECERHSMECVLVIELNALYSGYLSNGNIIENRYLTVTTIVQTYKHMCKLIAICRRRNVLRCEKISRGAM